MAKTQKKAEAPSPAVALSIRKRAGIVLAAFLVVCLLILLPNLARLQIVQYEEYKVKAENLQLSDTSIAAHRGTIYDANMKPLAVSATVWTVYVSPKEVLESIPDGEQAQEKLAVRRSAIAAGLADILSVDADTIAKKLENTGSYYELVLKKVEKPLADAVREFADAGGYSGIHLVQDSKRYYPYGDFAAGILGFVGTDNQGLAGLEAYYDDELSGTAGRVVSAKNAWGYDMPYEYEAMYEPVDGYSLVLTIDEVVQHYLEKYLSAAVEEHNVQQKGVAIAINVKTGEILGMSSQPDYDPNDPFTIIDDDVVALLEGLSGDEYKQALSTAQQNQWRNKAVSDLYEPGSVFKLVTAAAVLDSGVTKTTDSYVCKGAITVAGTVIHCANTSGHGVLTMAGALINSCNPCFIQMGQKLGAMSFLEYVHAFGLNARTGIDLPGEATGLVVSEDDMGPVELASSSFGQSSKVTPIEMIRAVATVVNGGYLVQPHLVSKVLDADGNVVYEADTTPLRQVISSQTSAAIASIMEEAVEPGNPCNRAAVLGYRVGGKSGTSQKLDTGDLSLRIASFVGIAPADDPLVAVLVILDEPNSPTGSSYGGVLCAPIVGSIISEAMTQLGVDPVYTAQELAAMKKTVPNTIKQSLADARMALQKKGLNYVVRGDGFTVVDQYPVSGSLTVGSTVVLYTETTEDETVVVPNFVGKGYTVANEMAVTANLNIDAIGSSTQTVGVKAISQSVEAGESVPIGTVITVDFLDSSVDE